MRITGTIDKWIIDKDEDEDEDRSTFSVSSNYGDFYKIDASELDETNLDGIIQAMKDQRPVIFTDELTPTVEYNGLDCTGYGQGSKVLSRWAVIKDDRDPASRTFRLRVRDDEGPIGYADVAVPDNPI